MSRPPAARSSNGSKARSCRASRRYLIRALLGGSEGRGAAKKTERTMSDITLFEAMYSARSIRKLSPDPVPEALVTRVLEAATQAPSGGNAQDWVFVVVRDPELRQKIGAIYRKGSDIAAKVY